MRKQEHTQNDVTVAAHEAKTLATTTDKNDKNGKGATRRGTLVALSEVTTGQPSCLLPTEKGDACSFREIQAT
jgi:hypothetical protein